MNPKGNQSSLKSGEDQKKTPWKSLGAKGDMGHLRDQRKTSKRYRVVAHLTRKKRIKGKKKKRRLQRPGKKKRSKK